MDRRKFIGSSCRLCLLVSSGLMIADSIGCDAPYQIIKTEIANDSIFVPLSSFDQPGLKLVRPSGWQYDIAVQKMGNGYEAMLLRCTHQHNQLIPAGKGYVCNLHGSTFDKDGNPAKGPAELPLKKYETEIEQGNLIIKIKSMKA
jgi:Rieske Fe-S protein